MSSPDESHNADYERDVNEADLAMREMMGFSTFGGVKRPKKAPSRKQKAEIGTGANSQPIKARAMFADTTKTASTATSEQTPEYTPLPPSSTTSLVDTPIRLTGTPSESSNRTSSISGLMIPASLPPRPMPTLVRTESGTVGPHTPSASATRSDADHNAPGTTSTTYSTFDIRSDPTYLTKINNAAYTNPHTGFTLTQSQMNEYSRGKRMVDPQNGGYVTTYFKPTFVEEGLWDRWESHPQA